MSATAEIEVVCPGMLEVLSVGKKRRRRVRTDEERFLAKVRVDAETGCWTWTGGRSNGYGQFRVREQLWKAHRWAWVHWRGAVPEGLDVDHECHNRDVSCLGGVRCRHRRCVNPEHLRLATRSQNLKAGRGAPPPQPKLTEAEVVEIRVRYANGGTSTPKLGAEYGVANSVIHNLVTGKTWKDVGGPLHKACTR